MTWPARLRLCFPSHTRRSTRRPNWCELGPFAAEGKLTFLRVHELGTGYGPSDDFLDAEAIVKLDGVPDKSFGLALRADAQLPARRGMLHLLEDAYEHKWKVGVEYVVRPAHKNGRIVRVYVTR